MLRLIFFVSLLALADARSFAQPARPPLNADLVSFLSFEHEHRDKIPAGWSGTPPDTISVDDTIVHSGKHAVRFLRTAASANTVSVLTTSLPIDFSGQRVELRGFLRTEDVTDYVGLWLRQDGTAREQLALDNMQKQQLKGTTDWREYTITLPLHRDARTLVFGVLVAGTGKAWADDLQLLVDGQPIWQAPKVVREQNVLEQDREFDAGSKIALRAATPLQIENLAMLGRVWGFLKYHHPKVTSGQLHWDYELFRVMPAILVAADRAAANEVLAGWIERLGELKPEPITALSADLHLSPDLAWLDDRAALGARLAERLRAVNAARSATKSQFYLSFAPAGNPVFDHEPGYTRVKPADAGYQLLALFRFWNIIRYWSPYRNLTDDNWDTVLAEFIPRLGHAATVADYQRELIALVARVHDTHTNLPSGLRERPPTGDQQLPAVLRFIQGHATVVRSLTRADDPAPVLQRGDVIRSLDGTPVEQLVKTWSPYYAASNETTMLRDIALNMGRGPAGLVRLRLQRGDATLDLEVPRVPLAAAVDPNRGRHDLPGPAFRLLSKEIAYLKLSAVKLEDVESYVARAAGTQGWIIDIRNYPSAFVVVPLGQHFVAEPTEFVRFTVADPANPGAFAFSKPLALQPKSPRYTGKIVILVDEVSVSQAEYTTMAFRTAPGAIVVGSTTAAADGNVSRIPLPGGQQTALSGIGVFYPDKRPTQRIGILPDIEARPTLAGIRAGRDEVLEVALRQILGPAKSEEEIRALIPARE